LSNSFRVRSHHWKVASSVYTSLLIQFGLSPASARMLRQLPPAKGAPLRETA